MADDYEIAIRLDPGAAIPTAQRVSTELGKAEQAGARVGGAISRGMREGGLATDRAARSADGLTAALRRERQMLDRIGGGRFRRDMETLDGLFTKNKISVQQYTAEITKLNRALERSQGIRPAAAPVPTRAPSGGLLGGAAALGGLAAGAGIGLGLNELKNAAVGYQNLQNRMRVVAGEGESVAGVFEKIRGVASATRSDLTSTAEAYVRLRGATKEMGLSSDQLLQITERINKAIKLSGASAQESSAGMMQLAQGLASGRLQGDELRSVLENLPYVADILAKSLGVTRGKLRELGSEGKITSQVIVDAFTRAGAQIDKDFGKTAPTLEEQMSALRDTFMVVVGQIGTGLRVFETLGRTLGSIGTIAGAVGEAVDGLGYYVDKITGGGGGGVVSQIGGYIMNPLSAVIDIAGLAKDGLDALADAMNANAIASSQASRAYIAQVEAVRRLNDEEAKLEQTAATLATARAAGVAVPGFDLAKAKDALHFAAQMKQTWGVDIPPAFDETAKKATEVGAAIEKIKKERAAKDLAEDMERAANAALGFNKALDANARHWKSIREELVDVEDALAKIGKDRAAFAAATGRDPLIEMQGKGAQDALGVTRQEIQLKRRARDLTDELNNSEYAYGETVVRIRKATAERRDDLEGVNAAYRDGRITIREYTEELRRLGAEEDRASKLLREIRQPAIDYQANIDALNSLLNQGRITLDEYSAAIKRADDAYGVSEFRKLLEGATGKIEAPKMVSLGGGPVAGGAFDDMIEISGDVSRERADALRAYRDEVERLTIELERASEAQPDLEKDLATQRALDEAFASSNQKRLDGMIAAQEASRSFEDGLTRGLAAIHDEVTNVAGALENTLVNAFRSAEDALVRFVTTGEFDFKAMVNSMLADLTRLLIRQAALSIFGAGGGTPSVFGTGATQAFTGLYGSAPGYGGGYAFGGDYRVGGSGGPDSQLVTFRLTPGEHVRFTPPGQAPAPAAAPAQERPIRIVGVLDSSAMRGYMESGEAETYYLTFARRNESVRGRTTGR